MEQCKGTGTGSRTVLRNRKQNRAKKQEAIIKTRKKSRLPKNRNREQRTVCQGTKECH